LPIGSTTGANGVFSNYSTTGYYPSLIVGDPGAVNPGSHAVQTVSLLMGMQLQGSQLTPSNNYILCWGTINENGVMNPPGITGNNNGNVLMYLAAATGNLNITGTLTQNSDERLKKEIEKVENSLEIIGQLTGVKYTRIDTGERNIGFLAQDVKKVLPEVIHEDENGFLSIAYGNMLPVCLNAINELRARVEDLERKMQ
jgi:hypothetical protein